MAETRRPVSTGSEALSSRLTLGQAAWGLHACRGLSPHPLRLVSARPSPGPPEDSCFTVPLVSGSDQVPGRLRGPRVWVGPSPRPWQLLAALPVGEPASRRVTCVPWAAPSLVGTAGLRKPLHSSKKEEGRPDSERHAGPARGCRSEDLLCPVPRAPRDVQSGNPGWGRPSTACRWRAPSLQCWPPCGPCSQQCDA